MAKQTLLRTKHLGELLGDKNPLVSFTVFLSLLLNYEYIVMLLTSNKYSLTFIKKTLKDFTLSVWSERQDKLSEQSLWWSRVRQQTTPKAYTKAWITANVTVISIKKREP